MCANPAVTNDVGVANDSTLAYDTEGECGLFAVGLELFFEGCSDFGVRLVEQLRFYKFHGDFGEHGDFAAAHFVTHVHGVADHVADFSAADNGAYILDHRTTAYQNVAEHGHLMDKRVFDKAVVYKTVVNTCGERYVARQQECPKEFRQEDFAHERRTDNSVRIKVGFDHDLVPGFGAVAILFKNLDLVCGQVAVFCGSGPDALEIFDGGRQNAVLEHFFQF